MNKTLIFAMVFGAAFGADAQSNSPPGTALSSAGGRYVFGQISEYRRDQYMLDTLTGRLWVQTCAVASKEDPKQCAFSAMQPVAFSDSKGGLTGFTPPASVK